MNLVALLWGSGFDLGVIAAAALLIVVVVGVQRGVADPTSRRTIRQLILGPTLTALIGWSLYRLLASYLAAGGSLVPSFLTPPEVLFLVELAVLSSATGSIASATRRHLPRHTYPGSHFLVYGVYAAALLVLVVLVLTSPGAPHFAATTWQVLGFLTGILATYFVVHITDLSLRRYLGLLAAREPGFQTVYVFVRRLILGVLAFAGVAVTAFASFPNLTAGFASIVLAAGFLSIVVGLAAQTSISNVIAGTLVSLTQPFRIGDAVVFGGEYSFVEDIRLTFTILRTWDNRRLMIPNSQFMTQFVVNYTALDATMLVPLTMRISYDSNMERAMELMREEALHHPACRPVGDLPNVVVMDYADNGVVLRVLSRAVDQGTAFQMERDLLRTIRGRFETEGIRLAVPYREVLLPRAAEGEAAGTPTTSSTSRQRLPSP
ncbi:MAG: mechanosensitive ion channel family protein [Thermoplasmata archaeon]